MSGIEWLIVAMIILSVISIIALIYDYYDDSYYGDKK